VTTNGGEYHVNLDTKGVPPGSYVIHVRFASSGLLGDVQLTLSLH